MILDCPNQFGWVLIVWGGSNSFWMGQNHFGQFQVICKYNLVQKSMIWTWPKFLGLDQNNFDPTKAICICPKQFGQSKIILDLKKDKALQFQSKSTLIKCTSLIRKTKVVDILLTSLIAVWRNGLVTVHWFDKIYNTFK